LNIPPQCNIASRDAVTAGLDAGGEGELERERFSADEVEIPDCSKRGQGLQCNNI
jgi:hypothetical protein